jgi:hypothetical protein
MDTMAASMGSAHRASCESFNRLFSWPIKHGCAQALTCSMCCVHVVCEYRSPPASACARLGWLSLSRRVHAAHNLLTRTLALCFLRSRLRAVHARLRSPERVLIVHIETGSAEHIVTRADGSPHAIRVTSSRAKETHTRQPRAAAESRAVESPRAAAEPCAAERVAADASGPASERQAASQSPWLAITLDHAWLTILVGETGASWTRVPASVASSISLPYSCVFSRA